MNLAHLPAGPASPNRTPTIDTLSAALAYAARGWPVLPVWWPSAADDAPSCACGGVEGCRPAKHPIGPLAPRGLCNATTDPATLRAWWRAYPRANVAIILGPAAGMWALDVDPAHSGDRSLIDLVLKHGPLGGTLHACTGGGGDHFFFRWPGRPVTNSTHRLGPGLDIRGIGGYVVAPPSLHISGSRYTWEHSAGAIVDAPPWLLGLLDAPPTPTTPRSSPTTAPSSTPGGGDAQARAVAYLARMPAAVSGRGGHAATLAAALALVRGFSLPPPLALEILLAHYNPRCEPPWSRRELEHKIATAVRAERVGRGYLLATKGAA